MGASSGNGSSNPEVQHFMRIPWCVKYLTTAPDDLIIKVHENRTVLSTWENQFVGGTLNTPDTITAWVGLYQLRPGPEFRIEEFLSLMAGEDRVRSLASDLATRRFAGGRG